MNVFDKPDEQRPSLLGLCHGEKTKAKSTFSVSQKTKASKLSLAWRENEGEVNVFDKPDEQRPSLLGLCHGEKTKAKSTFSISQKTTESLLVHCHGEKRSDVNPTVRHHTPKTKTMEGGCMFFL